MNNKTYNKGVTRLMLALMAAGLGMTACSSDESLDNGGKAKNAVMVNITTRSGETTSPWTANDAVTILCNENGSEDESQSTTYTWSGTEWNATDHLYWPYGGKNLDFMGYYPTSAASDGLEFTIPTDQSSAAKLHAADYMTTDRMYNVSNSNASHAVDFAFSHRLVKLTINISVKNEYGTDFTLSDVGIYSASKAAITVNNADNSQATEVAASGENLWITPCGSGNADGSKKYTAIVTPRKLVSGINELIKFTINDTYKYVMVYTGNLTALESGKAYTFNLKVGRDEVNISSITVNDWEEGQISYIKTDNTPEDIASICTQISQEERKLYKTLTLNLDEVTESERNNYLQKFATYFPNVTTLIVSGKTIPLQDMFNPNKSITTMVCNNLETIKPDEYAFQRMDALKHVSFAKLKDLGNATKIFYYTDNITDIAFGTEDEMTTSTDKEFKNIFNGPMGNAVASQITTLYLNENGYEYKNEVNLTNKTWRGITFKDIKKYSEYPYNVE